jgi:hypothetical protein
MSTNLGYGAGLVERKTVRNNDATGGADILAGQVVRLTISGVGTASNGDAVLLGELSNTAANDVAQMGIAERDIAKGASASTGEGDWGHVVERGLVKCRIVTTVDAGDAITTDAVGNVKEATAAELAAGQCVGVFLEGGDGSVTPTTVWCFVNFVSRPDAATGYGGLAP